MADGKVLRNHYNAITTTQIPEARQYMGKKDRMEMAEKRPDMISFDALDNICKLRHDPIAAAIKDTRDAINRMDGRLWTILVGLLLNIVGTVLATALK